MADAIDNLTIGQVAERLRQYREALPPRYAPGNTDDGEGPYYDAANPLAEAEAALSTLRAYLRDRGRLIPGTPEFDNAVGFYGGY